MKKGKKGFTLVEIIVVVVLIMVVSSILIVNFTKNLQNSKEIEYKQNKTNIESAADAFVTTIKNDDDIKLVVENDDTFTYITVDEIIDAGFINDYPINPITGEKMNGVVKFSIDKNGTYHFEYLDKAENSIIILYKQNGASSISRTAQAFVCEDYSNKESLIECIKTGELPKITRNNGEVVGWATANKKEKDGNSLMEIIQNSNYELNSNYLTLYAITKETKTINFNINTAESIKESTKSCNIYNNESSCNITLPTFTSKIYYKNDNWNTKQDGSGTGYKENENISISNDMTLYATSKIENFNILVNRINRVSSQTTTPANINIVLVLDGSGSMSSNNRLNNLKKVCLGLVDRMNLNNSTLSIITFGTSANKLIGLSQNITEIKNKINSMTASGGTNFNAATKTVNNLLKEIKNNKETYVVFVSDGVPTTKAENNVVQELKSYGKVYAMAIGSSGDSDELRKIATDTSTYYTYNDSADDMSLKRFYGLFEDIIQDLLIVNGDGIDNAKSILAEEGIVSLGNKLILQNNYPFDIYLGETLLETYKTTNKYFYKENENYYFNAFEYAKDNNLVGLTNREQLRIKYFDTLDRKE